MKKLIALMLMLFMLASMLSVTAWAGSGKPNDAPETEVETKVEPEFEPEFTPVAPPAEGVVLGISALKGESTVFIENCLNFEEGWKKAISLASSKETMRANGYERIVVDFYADWKANDAGEFGEDGTGINWSTLDIPSGTFVTINLNGYTIDRDLKKYELDGEVLCICSEANVIINNGIITGGWSCNGAGGIHIKSNAEVYLNNVYVMDNAVEDDKGAGIALYSNARLTMVGGGIMNNTLYHHSMSLEAGEGAALYLESAGAQIQDAMISGNNVKISEAHGVVASMDGSSSLILDNCVIKNNSVGENLFGRTLFYAPDMDPYLEIRNGTKIINNGTSFVYGGGKRTPGKSSAIFFIKGDLLISDSFIEDNGFRVIFIMPSGNARSIQIYRTEFLNNKSLGVSTSAQLSGGTLDFTECKFRNNVHSGSEYMFESIGQVNLKFIDCDLGDTKIEKGENNVIQNTNKGIGSILSQGSVTMIVALVSLAVSGAAFGVAVVSSKKKG